MNTLGETLASARKAASLTQDELAHWNHVARNTISEWEHGRTVPGVERLQELSQVLNHGFLSYYSPICPLRKAVPPKRVSLLPGSRKMILLKLQSPGHRFSRRSLPPLQPPPAVISAAVLLAAVLFLIIRPREKKIPTVWTDEAGVRYQPSDFSAPAGRKETAAYLRTIYKTELADAFPSVLGEHICPFSKTSQFATFFA